MKKTLISIAAIVMLGSCTKSTMIEQPKQEYEFTNGYPALSEIPQIYDELDYQRAVQSYLWATPAVATYSFIEGLKRDYKADMSTVNIWENSASPKTVVLTGNSQSIYSVGYFDLSETGPMVLDIPENLLGMVNDIWYSPITDLGLAGPDRGQGGKYLIVPPHYEGELPEGYHTFQSSTYLNIWLVRGFKGKDGSSPVNSLKQIQTYPLNKKDHPPKMKYKMVSNINADLTFPTDERFFEQLSNIVSKENIRDIDLSYLGMLQTLGIESGKPFTPNEKQKSIFVKAAKTGNAMSRAIAYSSRNEQKSPYENSQWEWIFLTENPNFYTPNYLDLEARLTYTHQACFTANAMVLKMEGIGSQYIAAYKDNEGVWLDGAKNYKLTLPPNVPVRNFWSLMVYDADTRSMVVTDTQKAGIDSYGNVQKNKDGSIDLYMGPDAPEGLESNWVKTDKTTGFFVYLRLFGPEKEFMDKTWRPSEIQLIK
ncbi:DUF1254 domain-containing protein [Flammeovirga sp. SubArs3]|uniref:DUF1254 domain-containing protein n=1 Tax=Flammeovirga sp. SubArs3 TaxID=2995316 RepID=UPI00248C2A26|nr:DUF1254 domain-containing protein [Flammeovirga sp. SubArs3]